MIMKLENLFCLKLSCSRAYGEDGEEEEEEDEEKGQEEDKWRSDPATNSGMENNTSEASFASIVYAHVTSSDQHDDSLSQIAATSGTISPAVEVRNNTDTSPNIRHCVTRSSLPVVLGGSPHPVLIQGICANGASSFEHRVPLLPTPSSSQVVGDLRSRSYLFQGRENNDGAGQTKVKEQPRQRHQHHHRSAPPGKVTNACTSNLTNHTSADLSNNVPDTNSLLVTFPDDLSTPLPSHPLCPLLYPYRKTSGLHISTEALRPSASYMNKVNRIVNRSALAGSSWVYRDRIGGRV